MGEAERAYSAAERLIEDARKSGVEYLSFDRALEKIPDSIATLSELRSLSLDETQISDLSPISGLIGLTGLSLQKTHVSDLSPISGLSSLIDLAVDRSPVSDLSPVSGLTGLIYLWLNNTSVSDLSPISGLTGLRYLSVCAALVSDLTPISSLTSLKQLSVDDNPVFDLRPIRELRQLVTAHNDLGLSFAGCAAARADPKIASIAGIEDSAMRARALFDYLEDWEPPAGTTPSPDFLIPVTISNEQLEIVAIRPSEEEAQERLKRVLYQQLRGKSADLARAAGNRYPQLAARARALDLQLQPDFIEADILLLHLAIEDLRLLHEAGAEQAGDLFPVEVLIPLGDVLIRGPGITFGNPLVDTLVERGNRRRAVDLEPEVVRAQNDMSAVIAKDVTAIGDNLRALHTLIQKSSSADAQEVQWAANRNVLLKIAASVPTHVTGVVSAISIEKLFGPSIGTFIQTNLPILVDAAATYGPDFKGWFMGVMLQVQDMADIYARHKKMRGR